MKSDRAERATTSGEHKQSDASDEIRQRRERALDKTVADSFPTSDPPSSIPDPSEADPLAA